MPDLSMPDTPHPYVGARARKTRVRRNGRWAHRIAARYGLTLPEARAELRRCANNGWQTWEFRARFDEVDGGR